MRMLLGCFAVIIATCNPVGAHAQASPPPWKRGIFVFGQTVLDFGYSSFRSGIYSSELTDCSNVATFCARTNHVNIVVPRVCEPMALGLKWSHDGITTTVIDQLEEPQGHLTIPGRQLYALATEGYPDWIFLYSGPRGVVAIAFDPGQSLGLRKMAQEGRLGEFVTQALSGAPLESSSYRPLITADSFAACAETAIAPQS